MVRPVADSDRESAPLARVAYEERDRQLRDTRGALAELVSELTEELRELRNERQGFLEDNRALRQEVDKQLRGVAQLNEQLEVLRNLRVVRWTVPLRRFAYRLRRR
jgi:uncharacterized coiled-coil DUF342 family protein